LTLPTVQREVEGRLLGFLDAKLEASRGRGQEVTDLFTSIYDLCARGGKRLRPALLLAAYRGATTSKELDPAFDAGVALELLQAYLLIHDDWMDQDDVRRGGPSVHAHLGRRFRSKDKGDRAAILAGDLAAALALEALGRVDCAPRRSQAIVNCFAEMQQDAVMGQQLDLIGKGKNVEHMYALKTGSYTVRGPLRLGALLGGANAKLLLSLDRFAIPAGIAFQLKDDLLGAFGDPSATGKPRGSDLKAGKNTVLLQLALKRAKGADLGAIKSVRGNPRASDRQIARATEALEHCGAQRLVQARIEELCRAAENALDTPRIRTPGRELLSGALRALTQRSN
jgi:geranylgeranyl diphosphate synthase type I